MFRSQSGNKHHELYKNGTPLVTGLNLERRSKRAVVDRIERFHSGQINKL